MARKSSKTSHVLNLLAGSQQEEEEIIDSPDSAEEDSDIIASIAKAEVEKEKAEKEAKPKKAVKKTTKKASDEEPTTAATSQPVPTPPSTMEMAQSISIVNSNSEEDDLLSEVIHENLLNEYNESQKKAKADSDNKKKDLHSQLQRLSNMSAKITATPPILTEEHIGGKSSANSAKDIDPIEAIRRAEEIKIAEDKLASKSSKLLEAVNNVKAAEKAKKDEEARVAKELKAKKKAEEARIIKEAKAAEEAKKAEEARKAEEAKKANEAKPINIIEVAVRKKIGEFLTKFGCCTCPKCTEEAIAKTINELPTKSVLLEANDTTMKNYYVSKHLSDITIAATRVSAIMSSGEKHE